MKKNLSLCFTLLMLCSPLLLLAEVIVPRELTGSREILPKIQQQKVRSEVLNATSGVTLYGNLIFSQNWGETDAPMGVYQFDVAPNPEALEVYVPDGGTIGANGGATLVDSKYYYCITYSKWSGTIMKNELICYDIDTWEEVSRIEIPKTTISTDMTWNPVDGKVYGAFYNTSNNGYVFGTLNLETGEVNVLSDIKLDGEDGFPVGFVVIAANSTGEIYGISSVGELYKFNLKDGSYVLIGDTGFKPLYTQSGCFDFTTKELYWAACNEDSSGIYQVDVNTGKATLIGSFNNLEEFVGLYSLSPNADLSGPGMVADVTIDFDKNSLSGKISFKLPTQTVSGGELTGEVEYTVKVDSEVVASDAAAVGSLVELPQTLAEGKHVLLISVKNTNGNGPDSRTQFYVGTDTPASVETVTAEKVDNGVKISWDAVKSGANGGYVDLASLTYSVVRLPDNKVVIESTKDLSVTDSELPNIMGNYCYSVTVTDGVRKSVPTVSAEMLLGAYMEPPYIHDFKTMESFDWCTIINANNDDKEWTATVNGAQLNYSRTNDADDWIISPPISMKAGYLYTVVVKGRSSSSTYEERLEVKYGSSPTVEGMTDVVLEPVEFTTGKEESFETMLSPKADGVYYIGLHGISEKYKGTLYIYSLEIIDPVNSLAPAAGTELVAVAAEKGVLSATITVVAPDKRANGEALSNITKAEVWNLTSDKLVATIENPSVGERVSATDMNAVNGFNTYSVVFYNEAGKGYKTECKTYVGIDIPSAVESPVVTQTDGKAVISWEAPTIGVNGGYVDAENLTYKISKIQPQGGVVATGVKGLTFTDETMKATDGQVLLSYAVSAESVAGEGELANTNSILFGMPYAAPFTESWPLGKATQNPWIVASIDGDYATWTGTQSSYATKLGAQDGDDGWISFSGPGAARLISPKINLSSLDKPLMKIWICIPDGLSVVELQVSTDLGITWQTLQKIESNDNFTWVSHVVNLEEFKNEEFVQLGILGSSTDWGAENVQVDNLRIVNGLDNDLVLDTFVGPESVVGAQPAKYSVTVYNDGMAVAEGYNVCVYDANENKIAEQQGTAIEPNAYKTFDFDLSAPVNLEEFAIKAKVEFASDQLVENNEKTLTVAVTLPKYPVINDLAGEESESGVNLTWSKPALQCMPDAKVDDIESYEEWTIGGISDDVRKGTIGGYTVYDGDEQTTTRINVWCEDYPNVEQKMAFQVMSTNSEDLTQQLSFYGLTAHSGKQLFACWNAYQGTNDDYLILPEIRNGSNVLTFWARSIPFMFGMGGEDVFEIIYSTTGTEIADFVALEGSRTVVPDGFEQDPENGYNKYEFNLPDDAKYVAIHCMSSAKVGLLIDDIEFVAADAPDETLELLGYNLYRNDELYQSLLTSESFVDADVEDGKQYRYNVTAVFDKGESGFSNTVDIAMSGLNGLDAENVIVYAKNQSVMVKNAENSRVQIYRIDGVRIYDNIIVSDTEIRLEAGIYIVSVDNQSFKVNVR